MASMPLGSTTSAPTGTLPRQRGWLAVCLAVAVGPAAGRGEPNRPAATAPSVTVSLPTTEPAPTPTVADRIVPTKVERTVLEAVRDRTWAFDETGLYAMLALAARAPELEPMQWHELDRPAYANLMSNPRRYRCTPLRARVRVHYVAKLQSGAGLGFRKFWPKDRPVWEMDCLWADEPYEKDKPVRVYSLVDPTPLIGEPDEVGPRNRWKYNRGRDLRIAALFYKIIMARQETARTPRAYPMMMAWQLSRTAPWQSAGQWGMGGLSHLVPLLILVIIMAAGFYYTRRRLAKLRQADRDVKRRYRPLGYPTDEEAAAGPDRATDRDKETPDGPVDPELTAAVEEFFREQEHDDGDGGTDHRG